MEEEEDVEDLDVIVGEAVDKGALPGPEMIGLSGASKFVTL